MIFSPHGPVPPVLGSFEGRATIEGATVTLKQVTQEDAGEYRCEISAPLDTVSLGETNVTLKVLGTGAGRWSLTGTTKHL